MPELQFAPLWRPIKVNWRYPHTDRSKILETIKSKRARKFLRAHQEVLQQQQLTIATGNCSPHEYKVFQEFYATQFTQKQFDIFATDQWFQERLAEHKQVRYFFMLHDTKPVAAKIFTVKDKIYRSSFKVSDPHFFDQHHYHNASLGLLIDFLWLDQIMQEQPRLITGGSSRNLFGYINHIGYLIFKLRIGYEACLPTQDGSFETSFEQTTQVPTVKPWLAFLSQQPKLGERLELYSGGDITNSNQYQELLALSNPQALEERG